MKAVGENPDFAFIIRLIEYLSSRHGIRFFISSADFDQLYAWWENRIPESVMKAAFDAVVERRRRRSRAITSFANFRYEVRKQYAAWLERGIGGPAPAGSLQDPVDAFLDHFPDEIMELKPLFTEAAIQRGKGRAVDMPRLRQALAERFSDDRELEIRVRTFMLNLSPELRKEKVAQSYRENFLWNRFRIPDFTAPPPESGTP